MELELKILKLAKDGGYLEEDIPTEPRAVKELADYYIKEANLALEAGMHDKYILEIVELSGEIVPIIKKEISEEEVIAESNGDASKEVSPKTKTISKFGKLPIPNDIVGDILEMPFDMTKLNDIEIRKLYSAYNAYMNRAKWLLTIESNDLQIASHLREEAYRNAFKEVPRIDEETGKSKVKDIIDAEARDDKEYQKWNEKVREHTANVTSWKALTEIYGGNVDRLSREMTFRKEERDFK